MRGADDVMTESLKGFGRASGAMVAGDRAADRAGGARRRVWRSSPSRLRPRRPAAEGEHAGGEANLVLPDLSQVDVGGYNGRTLLMIGIGRLGARHRCSAWSSSTS